MGMNNCIHCSHFGSYFHWQSHSSCCDRCQVTGNRTVRRCACCQLYSKLIDIAINSISEQIYIDINSIPKQIDIVYSGIIQTRALLFVLTTDAEIGNRLCARNGLRKFVINGKMND